MKVETTNRGYEYIKTLHERVAHLLSDGLKYGYHEPGCLWFEENEGCDCGYKESPIYDEGKFL